MAVPGAWKQFESFTQQTLRTICDRLLLASQNLEESTPPSLLFPLWKGKQGLENLERRTLRGTEGVAGAPFIVIGFVSVGIFVTEKTIHNTQIDDV